MQSLWFGLEDLDWSIVGIVFLLLAVGGLTWLLLRKRSVSSGEGRLSPSRFRLLIALVGVSVGSFLTLVQAFVSPVTWPWVLVNLSVGVAVTGIIGGLEKILDIQTKTDKHSRSLRDLSNRMKPIEELAAATKGWRSIIRGQAELISRMETNLIVVDQLKETALKSQSAPLIHVTEYFVREFFDERFVIEQQHKATIKGRQVSIDAYRGLWDFLLQKQKEAGPTKPLVVRALHAAPLPMWDADLESSQGRRIVSLLALQERFIDAGGRFCRIVVNKFTPGKAPYEERCAPALRKMRDAGIDVVYIHHDNRNRKYQIAKIPDVGFIWIEDFKYGQGWTHDDHSPYIIKVTHVRRGDAANDDYSNRWKGWRSQVEDLRQGKDRRLVMPEDEVEFI